MTQHLRRMKARAALRPPRFAAHLRRDFRNAEIYQPRSSAMPFFSMRYPGVPDRDRGRCFPKQYSRRQSTENDLVCWRESERGGRPQRPPRRNVSEDEPLRLGRTDCLSSSGIMKDDPVSTSPRSSACPSWGEWLARIWWSDSFGTSNEASSGVCDLIRILLWSAGSNLDESSRRATEWAPRLENY